MAEGDRDKYINLRADKGDDELIDEEVRESFAQDQQLDQSSGLLKRRLQQHTDESPELSTGDEDSSWDDADGEEAGGGAPSTPDENMVDEIGGSLGISYSDTEPLHAVDKVGERDKERWELDPASDPERAERIKEEFHKPRLKKQR